MVDDTFAPARAAAVATVDIDGEAVLLDEAHDRLHHLNATAALLWRCFDGVTTVAELATEVSEELGLGYDAVRDDTLAIVRLLVAEDLVTGDLVTEGPA